MTGGGGTNTATVFSKLSFKTAYLGKIGNDNNGKHILEKLKEVNVDFLGVIGDGASGYSIVLDSLEGDRTILTHKGVNNNLLFKEINTKQLKTKWFYFSSMIGKSYQTLEKLATFAHKNKIKIAFNPSNYLADKGHLYLKKVISKATLLVLNKEEAILLSKKKEIKDLLATLHKLGPEIVVITDGKKGAYALYENFYVHCSIIKSNCVDTTGAGDTFSSTFLSGLMKKKSVKESLKMASINAASLITIQGAKKGILTYKQIMTKVKRNSPKIEKLN